MADDIFDFTIGARCRLSRLGVARSPRTTMRAGTIVGRGRSTSSIRVLFDGYSRPVSLHEKYVELISAEPDAPAPQRTRDVAERRKKVQRGGSVFGNDSFPGRRRSS